MKQTTKQDVTVRIEHDSYERHLRSTPPVSGLNGDQPLSMESRNVEAYGLVTPMLLHWR